MPHLSELAGQAASEIRKHIAENNTIRCVSHYDADGIASMGVIYRALVREGADVHASIVKRLDDEIEKIAATKPEIVIFTDLGSGQIDLLEQILLPETSVIVVDHHKLERTTAPGLIHVNPHLAQANGAREISGAGVAYFVSKSLSEENKELADLAIVGAVGDRQDSAGYLEGLNRQILKEGQEEGVLQVKKDLRFFGRQKRPAYLSICYTTEPYISGITGNESGCIQLFSEVGVPIKENDRWRTIADLSHDEKRKLATNLILRMIKEGADSEIAESIVGEVYTLLREDKGTELRDASSYSTLLNACGRNGYLSTGVAVCLGDRNKATRDAENILVEYRKRISLSLDWLYQNSDAIKQRGNIQFFHARGNIPETIIGTVASMALSSRLLDKDKPVVAFADGEEGKVKVSARTIQSIVRRGVDLAEAMRKAAVAVEGTGGGHNIAAGATIPQGSEDGFIGIFEGAVRDQYGKSTGAPSV